MQSHPKSGKIQLRLDNGKKNYSGVLAKGTFVIKKRKFSTVKVSHDKNTGAVTVRYKNAVLRENVDYKNDAEPKILTSLQTNFEEGTKKYK
ncbi:MAG: hypothetical protein K6F86_06865 [Lachnospiraceae bacterium]|nr:hypothetical protein [Lachnospiraceae bacterium]